MMCEQSVARKPIVARYATELELCSVTLASKMPFENEEIRSNEQELGLAP
jgi:hypothetical protein